MVDPIVLVRNADGILSDLEGNLHNELGQKLDATGNPIVEEVDEDVHVDRHNANRVDRHGQRVVENLDDVAYVDRHNANRVDRQGRNAADPNLVDAEGEEEERTLAEYNMPNQFYTKHEREQAKNMNGSQFSENLRFGNQQGYRGFCRNGQISTFTCNQNSSGYSFTKNFEARYQAPLHPHHQVR